MAAHDLKSLAARLSALSQNLKERFDDPLFRPVATDLLSDTVSHLRRLASDIRDHEGRLTVKLRVDLNSVIEEAAMDTKPAPSAGCAIVLDARELPAIWADAFLLRRAFACAIENALEAMSAGGEITITTRVLRRGGRERIMVEIADNGPGMDGRFLRDRLSCPLRSTKEGGLGLGVYTMGQVASLHGGSVRIASAPGSGTRVRFFFPVSGS